MIARPFSCPTDRESSYVSQLRADVVLFGCYVQKRRELNARANWFLSDPIGFYASGHLTAFRFRVPVANSIPRLQSRSAVRQTCALHPCGSINELRCRAGRPGAWDSRGDPSPWCFSCSLPRLSSRPRSAITSALLTLTVSTNAGRLNARSLWANSRTRIPTRRALRAKGPCGFLRSGLMAQS